jgi:hypothetical protein
VPSREDLLYLSRSLATLMITRDTQEAHGPMHYKIIKTVSTAEPAFYEFSTALDNLKIECRYD